MNTTVMLPASLESVDEVIVLVRRGSTLAPCLQKGQTHESVYRLLESTVSNSHPSPENVWRPVGAEYPA